MSFDKHDGYFTNIVRFEKHDGIRPETSVKSMSFNSGSGINTKIPLGSWGIWIAECNEDKPIQYLPDFVM